MPWGAAIAAAGSIAAAGISAASQKSPSASSFNPNSASNPPANALDPAQTSMEAMLAKILGAGPEGLFPNYNGQLTTAPSSLQNTSLAALEASAPGIAKAATNGAAGETQTASMDALRSILGSKPEDLTSYYKTNVFDPLNRTFQQNTLPTVLSALGGSIGGPQSTGAQRAIGDVTNTFDQTLAATQAQLAHQAIQDLVQNKIAAAQQVPSATAAPIANLLSLLAAGKVPTDLNQANLKALYDEFTAQNNRKQTGISDLLNFIFSKTTTIPNSTIVDPGSPGLTASSFNGLGGNLQNLVDAIRKADTTGGSYGYDPALYGDIGSATSTGGQALQSMGFFNPVSPPGGY